MMVNEIGEVSNVSNTLKDVEILDNKRGYLDLKWTCIECDHVNTKNHISVFQNALMICSHCAASHYSWLSEYLDDSFNDNVLRIMDKYESIVVWPKTVELQQALHKSPALLEDNVYIVDSSPAKQGTYLRGKVTYSPDIIHSKNVKAVILVATVGTLISGITAQIKENYPEVELIVRANDLVEGEVDLSDPDFLV